MSLPVRFTAGDLAVVEPDTGEVLPIRNASDRALADAALRVAELDRDLLAAKRALAAELRQRHGVGAAHAGGYAFTVAESRSWPVRATADALDRLARTGRIAEADVLRAMPSKPRPDSRQLKSLLERLMMSDPDAARILADACTVSPPSLRDIQPEAVEGREA